jgi:hypothetical protein
MFKAIKDWLSPPPPVTKKTRKPRNTTTSSIKVELTEKEKATAAGHPYVATIKIDLNPIDINKGSFELDWNDKFLLNLIKQGYKFSAKDTDSDIVDRWFGQICKNIVMEVYEQEHIVQDQEYKG